MDLQFDPIAKLSTTSYCLTLKTKDHEIQHMQLKLVHKIHLQCGKLLRLTSINRHLDLRSTKTISQKTYGFAEICTPKQSRNRPMVILQSVPSTKTIS